MLKLLLPILLLFADPPVGIKARPMVGYAPLTVTVTISLADLAKTRAVCLNLDGAVYSKSCWPPSRKVTDVTIKGLPEGSYDVWADVEVAQENGPNLEIISNRLTIEALSARE